VHGNGHAPFWSSGRGVIRLSTVTICPMPANVGRCPNPNRPTATAQPNAGGPRHQFACHRGHSQRGCEQAVVVGCSQGRWPEQAPCIRTAGFEGVTKGERAAGMP
jgi:hypothetical protein